MDFQRFVGIPFKYGQSSFEGADCLGLTQLFFHENGWPTDCFDDGKPRNRMWHDEDRFRMFRGMLKHGIQIQNANELQYGDIVYCKGSRTGFIGVYLGNGEVLLTPSVLDKSKYQSVIEKMEFLQPYFVCGFRRKA